MSIYMPAHRRHPEAAQDPIRFKNLLRSTEERLHAAGLQVPEEHELLHRGQALNALSGRRDGITALLAEGSPDALNQLREMYRTPATSIGVD